MNACSLLVSVLMLVCVLLSACTPAATPTVVPSTVAATAFTSTPINISPTQPLPTTTPKPLDDHVIAEWKVFLPADIAFGFDSVWITGHRNPKNTIRIDPKSNKQIAVIENTGYRAHSVLVAGDFVWVDGESDDMAKIDPQTNTIVARVPGGHTALAYGFDSIWSPTRRDELDRIDPETANIIAAIKLGDGYVDNNNRVMVSADAVWVVHQDEEELIKIDPTTNSIVSKTPYDKLISEAKAQTKVPPGKGTDFIWMPMWGALQSGLLRIDPNMVTGLTFLPMSSEQLGNIVVAEDAMWMAGYGNGQISRVNVTTNQIDATYSIQAGISRIRIGFGSIWVVYEDAGIVQRLDIAP